MTIVVGATGSGKTTQVPQYILEEAAATGSPCRIFFSQPRKLAAISCAQRIASERKIQKQTPESSFLNVLRKHVFKWRKGAKMLESKLDFKFG